MNFTFDETDIRKQVLDFMRSLGIAPINNDSLILDGFIHRYKTENDRGSETSGAYCIFTDGIPAGFVQDWRKDIKHNWKFDMSRMLDEQRDYFNSDEFKIKAEAARKKREKKQRDALVKAAESARTLWDALKSADESHPYFQKKQVNSYGIHIHPDTNALAVPLHDSKGIVKSIQWILPDGTKRFYEGASTEGLFYSVALDTVKDGDNQPILIGEGYATVAKAYELTGFPCVAAISCYHLVQIGKIIRGKFPKNKIIVLADDDKLTELNRGFNPGIREALKAVKEAKLNGFVVPPFKSPDEGTDWDDFALRYGDDYAAEILHERITWECLSDDEKKEISIRKKLAEAVKVLDTSVDLPPQEFIGGLFPRDFVSVLAAPSGTGKTIFMQKFVSDLSIGGSIFDGFADDEPARKSLIFAGEAGYEMLVRRGASMKWKNNPENIHVVDQYTFETKDIPIMLDDAEGWQNVLRIVDMYKPDIIFIDTFSSFHERDENKATEMKPIIRKLAKLARENHIAVVIVHHSRKRTAKERNLSLNQDDVIGSSILNRLVGLIVGIEPMKDDEKTLLVRPLKTWFSAFMPFTYRLTEDIYGHTRMQTDLAPAAVNNSKIYVWNYLQDTFSKGEWFSMGNIVLSEIKCDISERQLRRILTEFIKSGKLQTRGANRYTEYSLKGFKDKELDE